VIHSRALIGLGVILTGLPLVLTAACSSSSAKPAATTGADAATCAAPGGPVMGSADAHCAGKLQPTTMAACDVKQDAAAPPVTDCDYGPTLENQESDDDECKYHIKWTSTPVCQGDVIFTATLTNLADGSPAAGVPSGLYLESFQPRNPKAPCDVDEQHPGQPAYLSEKAPGVYEGVVPFDATGLWTIRFHIHNECTAVRPDSPHGHAAFRLTVP
jgi:hypothetical protein